jgi:AcrR family transcriptional regulator
VSPKVADPAVRLALIEHAARITAEEGRDALTLRRLTSAVGTSTMAVYTHFGGMDELRRAVRREGFARLARALDAIDPTDDPVADLCSHGWAYYVNGTTNPNLYRAMFMEGSVDETDADVGLDTFEQLTSAVVRCIDAGRFDEADPTELATQLWVTGHGVVTLELAGMMTADQARECLRDMGRSLCVSFGDTRQAWDHSFARSQSRFSDGEQTSPA